MKRFYIEKEKFNINNIILDDVEHNHLKNVLRTTLGEQIIVVCGDGFDYKCEVVKINKGDTQLKLLEKIKNIYDPKSDITFYQALIKSDNMALITQKLNELGVTKMVPFESRFITAKDKFGKQSKLQQIANQSVKQCKRSKPMIVSNTLTFKEMLNSLKEFDMVIFANECEDTLSLDNVKISPNKKVAVIVGSEGGFGSEEILQLKNHNAVSVSLGRRILRAETASLALASVISYKMGEWIL